MNCPYCNKEMGPGIHKKFCPKCGRPLNRVVLEQQLKTTPKKTIDPRKVGLLILLAVVSAGGVGTTCALLLNGTPQYVNEPNAYMAMGQVVGEEFEGILEKPDQMSGEYLLEEEYSGPRPVESIPAETGALPTTPATYYVDNSYFNSTEPHTTAPYGVVSTTAASTESSATTATTTPATTVVAPTEVASVAATVAATTEEAAEQETSAALPEASETATAVLESSPLDGTVSSSASSVLSSGNSNANNNGGNISSSSNNSSTSTISSNNTSGGTISSGNNSSTSTISSNNTSGGTISSGNNNSNSAISNGSISSSNGGTSSNSTISSSNSTSSGTGQAGNISTTHISSADLHKKYESFLIAEDYKEDNTKDITFRKYAFLDLNKDGVDELILKEYNEEDKVTWGDGYSMYFTYDEDKKEVVLIEVEESEDIKKTEEVTDKRYLHMYYGPSFAEDKGLLGFSSGEGHGRAYFNYDGEKISFTESYALVWEYGRRITRVYDGKTGITKNYNLNETLPEAKCTEITWKNISDIRK